jgi:hypothetical protein
MSLSATVDYGYDFSSTKDISTAFSYGFDLARDDIGHIGMVSAQISAKVRVRGFNAPTGTRFIAFLYEL